MLPFNSLEEAFKLYIDSTPGFELKTEDQLTAARYDFYAGCAAMSQLIIVGDQAHNLDEVFNGMQAEIMQHSHLAMAAHQNTGAKFDA